MKNVHSIASQSQNDALDLIRWCYAVAKLPADSPRFDYYVSRWSVPDKIARAKADGTFFDLVKHCPPIDPAWIRFVPSALDAFRQFKDQHFPPVQTDLSSLTKKRVANH